jgi:hypothetical protein
MDRTCQLVQDRDPNPTGLWYDPLLSPRCPFMDPPTASLGQKDHDLLDSIASMRKPTPRYEADIMRSMTTKWSCITKATTNEIQAVPHYSRSPLLYDACRKYSLLMISLNSTTMFPLS